MVDGKNTLIKDIERIKELEEGGWEEGYYVRIAHPTGFEMVIHEDLPANEKENWTTNKD